MTPQLVPSATQHHARGAVSEVGNMPYHTIPYHIIPYHTIGEGASAAAGERYEAVHSDESGPGPLRCMI